MQEFHSSGHHCCLFDVKCTLHTHMVESLLFSWWWYLESFGTGGKQEGNKCVVFLLCIICFPIRKINGLFINYYLLSYKILPFTKEILKNSVFKAIMFKFYKNTVKYQFNLISCIPTKKAFQKVLVKLFSLLVSE